MKKIILQFAFLLIAFYSFSQKKAVTETGEEVILYDNGTWKYAKESDKEKKDIPVNPKAFTKSTAATFLIKSTKAKMGVWIDSKKWSFKKADSNEDAEYELTLKDKDLYGMLIAEKIEVPLETLKTVALENARAAAPDIQVVKQEYRTVNGKKVLCMQMSGTTQGIKFTYYGYYYSNASGTVQLVTYTAQGLMDDLTAQAEELLNGLVTID